MRPRSSSNVEAVWQELVKWILCVCDCCTQSQTLGAYPCVLSQILTCVAFDEFVMFNRSNHSGKSSHDIIQLLHLLWVASLQHWKRERREVSGQWIQINTTQKYEREIQTHRYFYTSIVCDFIFLFIWFPSNCILYFTREQPLTCSSALNSQHTWYVCTLCTVHLTIWTESYSFCELSCIYCFCSD